MLLLLTSYLFLTLIHSALKQVNCSNMGLIVFDKDKVKEKKISSDTEETLCCIENTSLKVYKEDDSHKA